MNDGNVVFYNGDEYHAKDGPGCVGCDFKADREGCLNHDGWCSAGARDDKRDVIWIKQPA